MKVMLNSFPLLGPTGFRISLTNSKVRITQYSIVTARELLDFLIDFFGLRNFHVVGHDVCSFLVPGCDHIDLGKKNVTSQVRSCKWTNLGHKMDITMFPVHIFMYTVEENSAFSTFWLASLEVSSKYYSPISKRRKTKWLLVLLRLPRSKFHPHIKRDSCSEKYNKWQQSLV